MAIGSQGLAAIGDSPVARKRGMSPHEFFATLLVVLAATMLGALGGVWLAERDRSAGRQTSSSPHASMLPASQPLNVDSERPKSNQPAKPVSAAAARKMNRETISFGISSVRSIRHAYRPDYTEIAFELRGAELLKASQLHNPERVYFDLAESGRARRPQGRLKSRRQVSIADDRVAGVRAVRWESGAVRVVVDLKRPCDYWYRLSPGPPSLLILGLWTPSGASPGQGLPPQGASGISEAVAAERP
jgi:hypothetical protein